MQCYRLPTTKFGREGVWRYNGLCVFALSWGNYLRFTSRNKALVFSHEALNKVSKHNGEATALEFFG